MQALVQEFGEPGKPARECLQQWSGGEVSHWLEDLAEEPNVDRWICMVGSTTYYIFIGAGPLE